MVENLTHEQTHAVLRFLLHRMGLDTRGALMAQMPVAYSALYPSVAPGILLDKVRAALPADVSDGMPPGCAS